MTVLDPDYLFYCTDRITEIYEDLHTFAINDIARRIVRAGLVTPSAQHQIQQVQQVGELMDDVVKRIAAITGQSQSEVKRLFEESAVKSLAYDDAVYRKAGLTPLPIKQSPAMLSLLEATYRQTHGTLQNFTQSMAMATQETYFRASNQAYAEVSSGLSDYASAITRAVRETAQAGITTIQYASGHNISVEAGVRRAVLTGVNQAASKIQLRRMDELGWDLVEVTSHANARPSHALWQGKIYSRSGTSDKYPDFVSSTGYGTGPGLCGWNCRHSFFPYLEGVSRPAAQGFGDTTEAYELSQNQRAMERKIRSTKREIAAAKAGMAAADTPSLKGAFLRDSDRASLKLSRQTKEYQNFCAVHDLKTQWERMKIA